MNLAGSRNPAIAGPQGDAIPFFHAGRYHLFYLESPPGKPDQPERSRTPWKHVVSDDLVNWSDLGIALPLGEAGSPDQDGIWTGSIIAVDGVLHVFYTGGNRSSRLPQSICHATSVDGISFIKDAANPLLLPDEFGYESRDWRDPFVLWRPETKSFLMLLVARSASGAPGRRGVVAAATSRDLKHWQLEPDFFYAPGNTYCVECPEVFELGGRWRMVYSRFSESAATVYRDADRLEGPWRTPEYPALDGPRWYAAKSLEDARGRRIAFGWVHDRRDFSNTGEWLWAGDMCLPRELYVNGEDRLCVRLPSEIMATLGPRHALPLRGVTGEWHEKSAASYAVAAPGAMAFAEIMAGSFASSLHVLTVTMAFDDLHGSVGVALYSNPDLTKGLGLICEPSRGRVVLREWSAGGENDREGAAIVENWIRRRSNGELEIQVFVRGSVLEIFVDQEIALTHRFYADSPLRAYALIEDGSATVTATLAKATG